MIPTRHAILSRTVEWIHLTLPLLLLIALVVEKFSFPHWSIDAKRTLRFLELTVFFSGIHVALSYAYMFFLPRAQWWRAKENAAPWWQVSAWIVGMSLLFYAYWQGWLKQIGPYTESVFFLYIIFVQQRHINAQVFGYSCLYSETKLPRLTADQLERARRLRQLEKRLFLILAVARTWVLASGLDGLVFAKPSFALDIAYCVGLYLVCFAILVVAHRSPAAQGTNKTLFLLRLLLYPLAPFSFLALFAPNILHGVEYALLGRQMLGARDRHRHAVAWTAVFLLIMSGLVLLRPLPFGGVFFYHFATSPLVVQILAPLSFGLAQAHLWIDHKIFAMSRPGGREFAHEVLLTAKMDSTVGSTASPTASAVVSSVAAASAAPTAAG